jgi:hypothetical protein
VNPQSASNENTTAQVRYGLLDVAVALQLQNNPGGAPVTARSGLYPNGGRGIRIWFDPAHLMVSRALHRSDSLTIRFLVGLALVEFCGFWSSARDGAATTRGLKRLANIQPQEYAFGSGFASRLASSEAMRVLDALPIFSRNPESEPFDLFALTIEGRSPSDIRNWRVRDDQTEDVRPLPKSPPKTKPVPVTVSPVPDPFLSAFHARAKELLSAGDYETILEMTKEEEVARGC